MGDPYAETTFDDEATTRVESRARRPSRPRLAAREPSFDERIDGLESAIGSLVAVVGNRSHSTRSSDVEIVPIGTRLTRWLGEHVLALLAIVGAAGVAWLQVRDQWRDAREFDEAAAAIHAEQAAEIKAASRATNEAEARLRRAVTDVQVTQVESLERVEDLILEAHPRLEPEPLSPALRDAKAAAKRATAAGDLFRDETGGG